MKFRALVYEISDYINYEITEKHRYLLTDIGQSQISTLFWFIHEQEKMESYEIPCISFRDTAIT